MRKIILTIASTMLLSMQVFAQDAQQALIEAVQAKNFDAVKKVVEQLGADVNKPYKNPAMGKPYALHVACMVASPSIEIVQYLLDKGAKLDVENRFGLSPLGCLVSSYDSTNRLSIFKLLVEKGADINHVSNGGGSVLGYACERGLIEIVKLLVNNVKDVDARKNGMSNTPLMYAATSQSDNKNQIVDLLLAAGADPKEERKVVQGATGTFVNKTAADMAQEKGYSDLASKLRSARKIKVKR